MITYFKLAANAYAAHSHAAGGKTFDGKPLPTFDQLGTERQHCWVEAAKSIRKDLADHVGVE